MQIWALLFCESLEPETVSFKTPKALYHFGDDLSMASKRATLAEATFGTPPIFHVIVGWVEDEAQTMFEVAI